MDEIQRAKDELQTLETTFCVQGESFNENLTSIETSALRLFEVLSDKLERCRATSDKLQKTLCGTDLDVVEQSSDVDFEKIATEALLEIAITRVPEPPGIPLELLKQGVLGVIATVKDIICDLHKSSAASASTYGDELSSFEEQLSKQVSIERLGLDFKNHQQSLKLKRLFREVKLVVLSMNPTVLTIHSKGFFLKVFQYPKVFLVV